MDIFKKLAAAFAVLVMVLAAAGCKEKAPKKTEIGDDALVLASPDGKLELRFGLTADGTPAYSLSREGKDVILPSKLGFELRGKRLDKTYEQKSGKGKLPFMRPSGFFHAFFLYCFGYSMTVPPSVSSRSSI